MSHSSSVKKKINWSKEFVRFIKKLQKLPQYEGISYSCLATHKEVKKEFQRKKQLYLEQIKMAKKNSHVASSKKSLSTKSVKNSYNLFGGKRFKSSKKRSCQNRSSRKKIRGGGFQSPSITLQNAYNSMVGNEQVPTNIPYQGQLAGSNVVQNS